VHRISQAGLAAACGGSGGGCLIAQSTAERLVVKVPLQHLDAAASLLAGQPAVHWLTLHSSPRAANYYGTAISQCGASESIYDVANLANGAYAYNDEGKTPLWGAGLRVSVFEPSRWCWGPYSSAVNTLYASALGFTACDDPSERL